MDILKQRVDFFKTQNQWTRLVNAVSDLKDAVFGNDCLEKSPWIY